jgi:hypothetical protein
MDPINALAGTWIWFAAIAALGAVFFVWRRGRIRPQPAGWDAGAEVSSSATPDHAGHCRTEHTGAGEPAPTDGDHQPRPRTEPQTTSGGRRRHGCC